MKQILPTNITGVLLAFSIILMVGCGGNGENQSSEQQTKPRGTISQADSAAAPAAKLNINTASGDEFRTIPNVGDKMVHEFEEYRPYASIQQFRKEIGKYVDSAQVAAYEEYIYVPVRANESDAATMMQIPGLDAEEAEALTSGRPYATQEDFMDALSEYVDEDQMAVAKVYLGC